jgi:hypothetical protein
MSNPLDLTPSTDAGSDTAARYRYQAEVTLPLCLHCALGKEILSVIPEYFEDVCLETVDGWRFIQIKSRDPGLGLWGIADLLAKDGALRSLYRTHKQIEEISATLELVLEGATRRKDLIQELTSSGNHANPDLLRRVAEALEIPVPSVELFLRRVVLAGAPAPREFIKRQNVSLIQEQNVSLPHTKVMGIYESLMSEVERAMRAESIGPNWPAYVTRHSDGDRDKQERLKAKRLTRELLIRKVAPLSSPPKKLLTKAVDSTTAHISPLETKLSMGGATDAIIQLARDLRASSQAHLFDYQATHLFANEDLIADLNQRLKVYAVSKAAQYASADKPAINVWNSLLTELTANAAGIDLQGIMNEDPMLLLGQICDLSDNCVVDWGHAHAD